MRNNKKSLISSKIPTPQKKEETLPSLEPFHKMFPYAVSWEVKNGKKIDTNFAYFSYEEDRKKYIEKYLKNIKGIKRFKTKVRSK